MAVGFNSVFKGLRKSGAIPPLPIYALMAWTGKTTTSALHETNIIRSNALLYLYFSVRFEVLDKML
jgi:hypothetical protein